MPGKIYDLSDLDNLQLPPLPAQGAKKQEEQAIGTQETPTEQEASAQKPRAAASVDPLAVGGAVSADDFDLPPLPVKKLAKVEVPDDIMGNAVPAESTAGGDFDLPPLPKKAEDKPSLDKSPDYPNDENAVNEDNTASISESAGEDFDLPPLPVKKSAVNPDSENMAESADIPEGEALREGSPDGFDLPPLPVRKPENSENADNGGNEEISEYSDNTVSEESDDGFALPPLPERKAEDSPEVGYEDAEQTAEEYYELETAAAEPQVQEPAPRVSLEENPDMALEGVTPEDIGINDPSKALAPMRTAREAQARNVQEQLKMDDLAMNMDVPVLDDLSDEYAAPEKRADDLLERDHLESDEKQVLKQRLQEDLGRRPENFNARASRNMYNKLMEEKKLKIAKKGMMLSFIPIVMQLAAAGLCYFTMNWGNYQWFEYVAVFGAASALLLLIKSKHTKMFSIIISAMTVLMYVGPGLVLYALDEKMQAADDYIVHIVCAAAAALLNVGAILILTKNEPINIYYTTKFKRK